MRVLGAILAGGQARRFGSDKALAVLEGRALIDHVAAALRPQVDALVVCGRAHERLTRVPDRPAAGLGPLGGLAGALHHAQAHGFTAVVSAPCDTPRLPPDLVQALAYDPSGLGQRAPAQAGAHESDRRNRASAGDGAAFVEGQPVIGWWPVALAPLLDDHLAAETDRSLRRWIAVAGARPVALPPLVNVNRPGDLAALADL